MEHVPTIRVVWTVAVGTHPIFSKPVAICVGGKRLMAVCNLIGHVAVVDVGLGKVLTSVKV